MVNVSLTSSIGCPCRYLNSIEYVWPQGGAHTRLPSSCWCLRNRSLLINLSSTKKLLDPLCHAYPGLKCVGPTQHVIHSDFDFVLSYFIICFVPLLLFYMFVCLNLLLLFIHSSIVVSPARPVGKYPSFWFDSILHALSILTTAFECLTINQVPLL